MLCQIRKRNLASLYTIQAWCDITVSDHTGKSYHSCLRDRTEERFEATARDTQCGARRRKSAPLANHTVRVLAFVETWLLCLRLRLLRRRGYWRWPHRRVDTTFQQSTQACFVERAAL